MSDKNKDIKKLENILKNNNIFGKKEEREQFNESILNYVMGEDYALITCRTKKPAYFSRLSLDSFLPYYGESLYLIYKPKELVKYICGADFGAGPWINPFFSNLSLTEKADQVIARFHGATHTTLYSRGNNSVKARVISVVGKEESYEIQEISGSSIGPMVAAAFMIFNSNNESSEQDE